MWHYPSVVNYLGHNTVYSPLDSVSTLFRTTTPIQRIAILASNSVLEERSWIIAAAHNLAVRSALHASSMGVLLAAYVMNHIARDRLKKDGVLIRVG